MIKRFVQRGPFRIPFLPSLLEVGVVLETVRLARSKLITEVVLGLHGDPAP